MDKIKGKVIVLSDDIDTDQILPGYAMAEPYETLGKFAFAGLSDFDFNKEFEPNCIIVGGRNFGCGSSREQAPISLKQKGIALVIAKSFARIFRRNSINVGFPVWIADLREKVKTGDIIEVDLKDGIVTLGDGKKIEFDKMADNVYKTLSYGGLIPKVRAELGIQ